MKINEMCHINELKDLFKTVENDDQWISVSDMMTGLMVIFFIIIFDIH